jgi:NADH-quinone oxidoreductase subunit E
MPEHNLVCYATLKFDKEPYSLENYLKIGGYQVWQKVLDGELNREGIIDLLKQSGLRGRGGAGFPTGVKISFMPREAMDAVADYLGLPPIQVYEVASFYSMFETKPVGRHSISVCTNISCMLCGGEDMLAHVEKRLGIKVGESTADGRFFLKREEECLAACNNAPMMMVDHVYYENLTPEKVDEILDRHK